MKGKLAIQHVHLRWNKAGRGAHWGAVRNALPRELPHRPPFETERGWLHRVTFDARERYLQDEAWDDLGAIEAWRVPVKTRLDGDHLWLKMAVSTRWPLREHVEGWIARLPFGQRLTFRVNSKSDGDHERRYFEDHLHIGWAEACTLWELPQFREIDERVLLY